MVHVFPESGRCTDLHPFNDEDDAMCEEHYVVEAKNVFPTNDRVAATPLYGPTREDIKSILPCRENPFPSFAGSDGGGSTWWMW